MVDEAEKSEKHPLWQEQASIPQQSPKGVGWLLKPVGAGNISIYISGVEDAKEFTPESRRELEELMRRFQQEMPGVSLQGCRMLHECSQLRDCTGNSQTCLFLNKCRVNVGDCGNLYFCDSNA
jgi:hypothetical protein